MKLLRFIAACSLMPFVIIANAASDPLYRTMEQEKICGDASPAPWTWNANLNNTHSSFLRLVLKGTSNELEYRFCNESERAVELRWDDINSKEPDVFIFRRSCVDLVGTGSIYYRTYENQSQPSDKDKPTIARNPVFGFYCRIKDKMPE